LAINFGQLAIVFVVAKLVGISTFEANSRVDIGPSCSDIRRGLAFRSIKRLNRLRKTINLVIGTNRQLYTCRVVNALVLLSLACAFTEGTLPVFCPLLKSRIDQVPTDRAITRRRAFASRRRDHTRSDNHYQSHLLFAPTQYSMVLCNIRRKLCSTKEYLASHSDVLIVQGRNKGTMQNTRLSHLSVSVRTLSCRSGVPHPCRRSMIPATSGPVKERIAELQRKSLLKVIRISK